MHLPQVKEWLQCNFSVSFRRRASRGGACPKLQARPAFAKDVVTLPRVSPFLTTRSGPQLRSFGGDPPALVLCTFETCSIIGFKLRLRVY
jgi:hypothetical protein